jgi:hypothetical protein
MILSEADYSNIRAVQEASLSDKIKSKWKKFVAFIKGLAAKFIESISNILLDEKDYLEKYKDIILKKRPKEDMEYSYTGDYKKGINRLIVTEVPLFDYQKYKKELEAEENSDLINKIMSGKEGFSYDDSKTLDELFKDYFLAYDEGQQEGKFSDLNMTDIYNFCYNFNKVKGIVDKDISRLEASTRAVESTINKSINSTGNAEGANTNGDNNNAEESPKEESAIFREETNGDNGGNDNSGGNNDPKPEGLKISQSTSAASKMGSTANRDTDAENQTAERGAEAAKKDNKEADDISKAADKWISVCRPLIAAKLTACQQIAKDYMDIIRAHVRSYGGTDKKDKEGNKSPDRANKYSKPSDSIVEKAKKDAENAQKDADNSSK